MRLEKCGSSSGSIVKPKGKAKGQPKKKAAKVDEAAAKVNKYFKNVV